MVKLDMTCDTSSRILRILAVIGHVDLILGVMVGIVVVNSLVCIHTPYVPRSFGDSESPRRGLNKSSWRLTSSACGLWVNEY